MSFLHLKTFKMGFLKNGKAVTFFPVEFLSSHKISENVMNRFSEIFVYLHFWVQFFY